VTNVATQRFTIAKIAGRSASALRERFMEWSAARKVRDPDSWSPEQWPDDCRRAVDSFAAALRSEGHKLPVIFFNEHVDMWLMGDFFRDCLPAGVGTCQVCGDQFELACYSLPDEGRLAGVLKDSLKRKNARKHPQEEQWFRVRLLEAVRAWELLHEEALLVTLRQVLDATVTDAEVLQSLLRTPPWVG
jgi:hypothetical protein